MKKRLLLLPLVGGLLLSGCTFTLFGHEFSLFEGNNQNSQKKDDKDTTPSGDTTPTVKKGWTFSDSEFVFDFSSPDWKDNSVTPYISKTEDKDVVKNFTVKDGTNEYAFNDVGCYANTYDGEYYLMMKNTKYGEDEKQYADVPAFISNKTAMPKAIKKLTVVVNGGSSSASAVYRIAIGNQEYTTTVTEGGKTGGKGQTIVLESNASDAFYFAVCTNKNAGKSYNGQILKVTVGF